MKLDSIFPASKNRAMSSLFQRAMARLALLTFLAVALLGCGDVREEVVACDRTEANDTVLNLCTKALALDDLTSDERVSVLFSRGSILMQLERPEAAKADFAAIRRIDDNSPYAPRGLAYAERMAGNFERSIQLYEEAMRLAPNDATLVGLRGAAKVGLGDFEGAYDDVNFALDPPSSKHVDGANIPSFHYYRGISLVELGKFTSASKDLDHWVRAYPSEPWGLLYRGYARMELQDVTGAIEDFDVAMANGGSLAWLRDRLSKASSVYFGPRRESYEDGVRYSLRVFERLISELPNLNETAISRRRSELFPQRAYDNPDILYMFESGLGPLTLDNMSPTDRVASSYYYGVLLETLTARGGPTCRAAVKSMDGVAAALATTKDVLSVLFRAQSGSEFLAGLVALSIGGAVIESSAADDAVMLAARHGCASDVVLNILENGSKFVDWSMSL